MIEIIATISENNTKVENPTIKGIWFDAFNGNVSIKDIGYEIIDGQHGKVLRLKNGPTGWESVYIKDIMKDILLPDPPIYEDGSIAYDSNLLNTWVACSGTTKRYSKLEIPVAELRRILLKGGKPIEF